MSDWNEKAIVEFRATGGQITGFERQPVLLLHHKGARTGTDRVTPLAYMKIDSGHAIFASKAGANSNPDWFHNVTANPDTRIEVGSETLEVSARVAEGEEHDRIWTAQKEFNPTFASYEAKTSRPKIPVIVLESA
ncbi:MAG: nitroreductase/quinone reductase family protein [Acidimicrobiia bacterium]